MQKHLGRAVAAVVAAASTFVASSASAVAAAGVNITANDNGLPGLGQLQKIVGSLITVAVIAAVAGILISAGMWAVGNHSANPQIAGRGKSGVMVAAAAAILAGGALAIVNFFFNIGSGIG
jgi:hypothetical protein